MRLCPHDHSIILCSDYRPAFNPFSICVMKNILVSGECLPFMSVRWTELVVTVYFDKKVLWSECVPPNMKTQCLLHS